MSRVDLSLDESVVHTLVGQPTFSRAREYLARSQVGRVQRHEPTGRIFGQVRPADEPARSAFVRVSHAAGVIVDIEGACTCREPEPCSHAVALVLAGIDGPGGGEVPGVSPPWQSALAPLLEPPVTRSPAEQPGLGLQFEFVAAVTGSRGRFGAQQSPARIDLRPVVRGSGGWIRTGISWSTLGYRYEQDSRARDQLALLREIHAVGSSSGDSYYYPRPSPNAPVSLGAASSPRLWALLAEARDRGVPLVRAGRHGGRVVLHEAAAASLAVRRGQDGGLALQPVLTSPDHPTWIPWEATPLGSPVTHGITWTDGAGQAAELHLAPVDAETAVRIDQLTALPAIVVPRDDEPAFFDQYFPVLRARFDIVSDDAGVELPVALPPRLELVVRAAEDHRAEVSWQWAYSWGGAVRRIGLEVSSAGDLARDATAERTALSAVGRALDALPQPVPALTATEGRGATRLAPSCTLEGMQTVLLFTEVIPALRAADLADVLLESTPPDYRFAEAEPVITFSGVDDAAAGEAAPASAALPGRERDWFDLSITVEVDGRNVPFGRLFTALARQQKHLILDDGTVVRLGNDRFGPLLSLISESRAIADSPAGTIRASRYQASLLADLDDLGEFDGPAAAWRDAARALIEAPVVARREPPAGLLATLRPYQLEGFHWLATLYDNGLGGILADDMGLGKTLQALALILHARNGSDEYEKPTDDPQQTGRASRAPFLVVAPTSVMGTWVSEAERFAPGLRVVQIGETARRRRRELADLVRGADIVVTSYTLFRLEDADYAALPWAGVVLDEAQFAKNHRSVIHQKLRSLPAPFKLAITGTPMENSLMELWAILAITAPGLFRSASRFVDHYRTPIEKGRNQERLAQLRRRVKPLMLRRTKETVAADLPEKQEQVLMLELNPEHRREYQKHLHRERLKVLKLLTDLDQHRLEVLRSLTLLRQASLDISLIDRLVVDEERRPAPSTKLDAMMEMLEDIVAEGHRTLIFSQFTRFLTKAAARLDEAGIEYCYLDGRTKHRAEVIERFRTGSAPVFLISLKAGGFGLTLTEADYCLLLDPWWNPAAEAQAVDRVHRIGQTRNVNVYRMVAKDTIEEKVMALQAAKRELFGSVMDGGTFASAALDADDIRSLLD